ALRAPSDAHSVRTFPATCSYRLYHVTSTVCRRICAVPDRHRQLPLSPGRAESHGFEYKRNGTLSLFAALNTATGEVIGKTAPRH
ncbi:hypothetical protein AABE10_36350, partial [Paraburkholderia diazotrophica]